MIYQLPGRQPRHTHVRVRVWTPLEVDASANSSLGAVRGSPRSPKHPETAALTSRVRKRRGVHVLVAAGLKLDQLGLALAGERRHLLEQLQLLLEQCSEKI